MDEEVDRVTKRHQSQRRVTLRRSGFLFATLLGILVWSAVPAWASLPLTPDLELVRTIRTKPFTGSSISVKDNEGGAFVPGDTSLWIADDNGRSVYEVDPTTGALKRVISRTAFESAPRFGGGQIAGANRSGDLESMAYDQASDILYAFSGTCCSSSTLPTAFRLMRDQSGVFQVDSHQPLSSGSDYTAAAWNSADAEVYVGKGRDMRTYDYGTNVSGPTFRVSGVRGILGMGFSPDGADLFVTTNAEKLFRVAWGSKTIVPGWSLDLIPFGVRDSRGVELIDDQLFVYDGYDQRSTGDPLKHAVFVFDV